MILVLIHFSQFIATNILLEAEPVDSEGATADRIRLDFGTLDWANGNEKG